MSGRIAELLGELTLEEKVSLLAGRDMWRTPAIERLAVPSLKLTDGPNGARGGDMSGSVTAACFPVGSALAASWNVELVERVGAALGEEALSKRAQVLLAPTVNIHRSPLAGRNFEAYSEDPHLAARIAVAFVRGVQGRGVGCAIKHFVCNDSEFERHTISSEVDERALREIYLVPFEAAVREARPWALMSAYNRLNGTYCSEHPGLLVQILREEWGFDGFVVSDWFGTRSAVAALEAGLDLEMPAPTRHRGAKLVEAVRSGSVSEAQVDRSARRILEALERSGRFEAPEEPPELADDRPKHRELARRAAAEGIVLLRNEAAALPLDAGRLRRLALIGPAAVRASIRGGGSSRVAAHYEVGPLEAIRRRCGAGVEVVHEPGCTNHRTLPILGGDLLADTAGVEFFPNFELAGEPVLTRRVRQLEFSWLGAFSDVVDPECYSVRCTARFTAERAGCWTFALTSAGRSRLFADDRLLVDNWTRQQPGESFYGAGSAEVSAGLELAAGQEVALRVEYSREGAPVLGGLRVGVLPPLGEGAMERAVACARDADAAVVVVGLGPDWETEGRDRADMELPGRQAELIERVAEANARTVVVLNCGSPVTTDWIGRVPAALVMWYPGQECGNALADVLFGDVDASGRLPQTWPVRLEDNPAHPWYPGENGAVRYGEGVFVGYRHYDTRGVEPRFAFGHGLSYTQFRYGELELRPAAAKPGEPVEVALEVTNTGTRAGQEVVQLYVCDLEASAERPEQELRAFAKLALEPGETRTARFSLDERAFAWWDAERSGWVVEPGDFELRAGASSRDVRSRARLRLG